MPQRNKHKTKTKLLPGLEVLSKLDDGIASDVLVVRPDHGPSSVFSSFLREPLPECRFLVIGFEIAIGAVRGVGRRHSRAGGGEKKKKKVKKGKEKRKARVEKKGFSSFFFRQTHNRKIKPIFPPRALFPRPSDKAFHRSH